MIDLVPRISLADQVHKRLLQAIVRGELVAGDALHDHAWAERLGVSRTPIREAFKHLERHGLLEVAAARYTKLHEFTTEEAALEARHWGLAHAALADVLCEFTNETLLSRLDRTRDQHRCTAAPIRHAVGFAFFEAMREATANFGLRLGASAAAYRFRLAVASLPDTALLDSRLHNDVITALRKGDPYAFRGAFERWIRAIPVRPPVLPRLSPVSPV